MQEERLAEFLKRYHSGESNAATSRVLECVFSIKGIEVRQMVNRLRRKLGLQNDIQTVYKVGYRLNSAN